jgi:hypothetical protein
VLVDVEDRVLEVRLRDPQLRRDRVARADLPAPADLAPNRGRVEPHRGGDIRGEPALLRVTRGDPQRASPGDDRGQAHAAAEPVREPIAHLEGIDRRRPLHGAHAEAAGDRSLRVDAELRSRCQLPGAGPRRAERSVGRGRRRAARERQAERVGEAPARVDPPRRARGDRAGVERELTARQQRAGSSADEARLDLLLDRAVNGRVRLPQSDEDRQHRPSARSRR